MLTRLTKDSFPGTMGKGKKTTTLFLLFFAGLFLLMAFAFSEMVVSSFRSGGVSLNHILGYILLIVLVPAFWLGGAFFSFLLLSHLFGKTEKGKKIDGGETWITTLWGHKIMKMETSTWIDILVQSASPVPQEIAWSWSAIKKDSMLNKLKKNLRALEIEACEIVENALWNLIALKYVRAKARQEIYSYFFFSNAKISPQSRIYFSAGQKPTGPIAGVWENRLWDVISKLQPEQEIELFDLVSDAFGPTVHDPFMKVVRMTENEQSHARPEFQEKIRAFIQGHNSFEPKLENTIQNTIKHSLKNRVDVG